MKRNNLLAVGAIVLTAAIAASCIGNSSEDLSSASQRELSADEYPCTGGLPVFGPETLTRGKGKPLTEVRSFTMPVDSHVCVLVKNDRISAAWISIDGNLVIDPDPFNHNVEEVTGSVYLEEGDHEISVRLASGPKRSLSIEILAGSVFSIDPTIEPSRDSLPGLDGITERPVAGMTVDGDNERTMSFVANEIIVTNDDQSVVEGLVERYDGEVLHCMDADDSADFHLARTCLVRLNTEGVDTTTLMSDLNAILESDEKPFYGKLEVSNLQGAQLLTIVASEARLNSGIGINFLNTMTVIPTSTQDAGGSDAYTWPHFERCERHWSPTDCWIADTGVAEAWSLLYNTDRLERLQYPFVDDPIEIAFLDGGFSCLDPTDPTHVYPDWPDYKTRQIDGFHEDVDPCGEPNWSECGGTPCPWHGTGAVSVGVAIPDNGYGAAGTGGIVATPVLYFNPVNTYGARLQIYDAVRNTDVKIISMSWIKWTHWTWAWTSSFSNKTEWAYRNGLLLFAGAGNTSEDVNIDTCLNWGGGETCWDTWTYEPCESSHVICVGGTRTNYGPVYDASGNQVDFEHLKETDSNYGEDSVDLWAPWTNFRGPIPLVPPAIPTNNIYTFGGTSSSTPFSAGVAALVWKANPYIDNDDVWDIIEYTTNWYTDPVAGLMKSINAYDAVIRAIGFYPAPSVTYPVDGEVYELNQPFDRFRADITYYIEFLPVIPACITGEQWWTSSIDGIIADSRDDTAEWISACGDDLNGINEDTEFMWWELTEREPILSEGYHEISYCISAQDLDGDTYGSDTVVCDIIHITVENSQPYDLEIKSPRNGATVCENETVTFKGDANDNNQDPDTLSFGWNAVYPPGIDHAIGHGKEVTYTGLWEGSPQIVLTVSDHHGGITRTHIDIEVLDSDHPDCQNFPPQARISYPDDQSHFNFNGWDGRHYLSIILEAEASDDNDTLESLTFEWNSSVDGNLCDQPGNNCVLNQCGAKLHVPDDCVAVHRITLRVIDSQGEASQVDEIQVGVHGPNCMIGSP